MFYILLNISTTCFLLTFFTYMVESKRLDQVTPEWIEKNGEQIKEYLTNTTFNGKICEGVTDQHRLYEFWINVNGEEQKFTADLISKHVQSLSLKMTNKEEPWITGHVLLRPELNCVEPDSQILLDTLREKYIRPPSTKGYNRTMIPLPYPQMTSSYYFSQYGQDLFLEKYIFKNTIKDGFFVEAGADDSVINSNTLAFEIKHGWTGLLVEANPTSFPKGLLSGRNTWHAPVCLALEKHAHYSAFTAQSIKGGMAGLVSKDGESLQGSTSLNSLQCFPLYSLLLSVGTTTVDLFSLDIEGAEFQVLTSLPWDKVDIKVILVELVHAGKVFPGSRRDVHKYLLAVGYEYLGTLSVDDIFVRKDLNSPDRYGLNIKPHQIEVDWNGFTLMYDVNEGLPSQEVWDQRETHWRLSLEA